MMTVNKYNNGRNSYNFYLLFIMMLLYYMGMVRKSTIDRILDDDSNLQV